MYPHLKAYHFLFSVRKIFFELRLIPIKRHYLASNRIFEAKIEKGLEFSLLHTTQPKIKLNQNETLTTHKERKAL
jgi:hypothetical protein